MSKEEVYNELQKLLDDWDPLGVYVGSKPLDYSMHTIGEYYNYIKPIVETYLEKKPIQDYLMQLERHLWGEPNEASMKVIEATAQKIFKYLEQFKAEDLW